MSEALITRRYRFCAAHRLHTDQLSEEENWAIFGKCNNPNGHGHNYVVFVTVRGVIDPMTHQVLDVSELDAVVERMVVQRFDHQTTTEENLVLLIWQLLLDKLPAGRLEKVGVIETRDNYFEYLGSSESKRREEGVRHG